MNMEEHPEEVQTAASSMMPFKWTNWKSQFTEAESQDPLQGFTALNAQYFTSQVQVFFPLCEHSCKRTLEADEVQEQITERGHKSSYSMKPGNTLGGQNLTGL